MCNRRFATLAAGFAILALGWTCFPSSIGAADLTSMEMVPADPMFFAFQGEMTPADPSIEPLSGEEVPGDLAQPDTATACTAAWQAMCSQGCRWAAARMYIVYRGAVCWFDPEVDLVYCQCVTRSMQV